MWAIFYHNTLFLVQSIFFCCGYFIACRYTCFASILNIKYQIICDFFIKDVKEAAYIYFELPNLFLKRNFISLIYKSYLNIYKSIQSRQKFKIH